MCSPWTSAANMKFHSRSSFETRPGGTLAREKSLTLLLRDGGAHKLWRNSHMANFYGASLISTAATVLANTSYFSMSERQTLERHLRTTIDFPPNLSDRSCSSAYR